MKEQQSNGELLPLIELARQLPAVRGRKKPHYTTLYRWATKGLMSRSGLGMRLETKFVGGTLCATIDDVNRFFDSLDDVHWQPPVYRNAREEERMRRRGREAIRQALAA